MDIHHILGTVFYIGFLSGNTQNSNSHKIKIEMKKIFTDMKDVARIALIFLIILGLVKLFGWIFKTIFN